jgi:DNA-binding NtrC family response regulator
MDKKIKCLIVDDEKHFLLYLRILFEHNGYEVYTSTNVDNALEIIRKEKIEFIATDVNMPGKNGFQFLTELKGNMETNEIPVLVISSDHSIGVMNRAMELGAIGFMRKPFLQHHLKTVTEILSKKIK